MRINKDQFIYMCIHRHHIIDILIEGYYRYMRFRFDSPCVLFLFHDRILKGPFFSDFPTSAWARSFIVRQMGPCLMGFPLKKVLEFLVKGQLQLLNFTLELL